MSKTALQIALNYAERGLPVFPCNNKKHPLVSDGFYSASTDAAQIKKWWTAHKNALIGIPTGQASGLVVLDVDVDVEKGIDGFESLKQLEPLPKTLMVTTPRTGAHFYFKNDPDRPWSCSASQLGPGLDIRGDGGYIIAAGSVTSSGAYEVARDLPVADWPAWLGDKVASKKAHQSAPANDHAPSANSHSPANDRYVQAALHGEIGRLATAPAGQRNDALNRAAFSLGTLVGQGGLTEQEAHQALMSGATACGLLADDGANAVQATIRSGLGAGMANPRQLPDKTKTPSAGAYMADHGRNTNKEQPAIPDLSPVLLGDFMMREFPPRELILSPWLPEKGLAMLYANRGVGKTWVGLNIAWAIATGGKFLKWQAGKPRKVLIVDGEMPASVLQERLADVMAAHTANPPSQDGVKIIANDLEEFGIPDLATPEGQAALDKALGDADVIILDNLSSLLRSGRENESESWAVFQGWLLAKRRQGRAILMIHHAGKGGQQRGTSKREDVLDTVVNLKRPSDYEPTEGARFEVHFEKSRGFSGDSAEAFEAALVDGAWIVKSLSDEKEIQVLKLKAEGLTQREIAQEVGLSLSKVNRIINKAENGPGYGLKP